MTPLPLRSRALPGAALLAMAVTACAPRPPAAGINDPYETANRRVHEFNLALDSTVLRPAGEIAARLPVEVRQPVRNFSDNVGLPAAALNSLLQADIGGAATNTMRFLINSTVGILGLFDPAGAIGIEEQETDFGETLAVWGVPEGAYLVLPLFGPSTERDALGRLVDFLIDPLDRVGHPAQADYGLAARAVTLVVDRGGFGATLDSILYESADAYAQLRLIYLQNRRFELEGAGAGDYVDPYAEEAFIDPYAETAE